MTVTKEDLLMVVSEVVSQLSAKIGEVRTELRTEISQVRTEIAQVRTDLSAEIAQVRTDLSAEIAQVRTDLSAEIAQVRTESAASAKQHSDDITQLRHITSANHFKVVGRIEQVASMLAEHMADTHDHPPVPDRKRA